jgi:hypothetical protein
VAAGTGAVGPAPPPQDTIVAANPATNDL